MITRRQIIKTTNSNKNPSLNRSCLSNKKIIKQLTGVRLDYLGKAKSVGLIIYSFILTKIKEKVRNNLI